MTPIVLTPREVKLILFGRSFGFGEAKVEYRDGEPVRIINPLQSVVL